MDLHTSKKADWADLSREEMNWWQVNADRTNGWMTPGNVMSLAGGILVVDGLIDVTQGNPVMGIGKILVGRMCDIGDGHLAHATGTKSPVGEFVDASLDKVQIAAALFLLTKEGILPELTTASFAAMNASNVIFSAIAKRRGNEIHPTREGKLSMFGQWLAIGAAVTAHIFDNHDMELASTITEISSYALAVVSTYLGVQASVDYYHDAFASQKPEQA